MKELIRRVYYGLCWLGLADAEIVCTSGTIKHKFYQQVTGVPGRWPR